MHYCTHTLCSFCIRHTPYAIRHTGSQSAFTLVEVLLGITVLVVGIVGVFTLLVHSLSVSREVNTRFVASYLAQEGVELARAFRDQNLLVVHEGTCDTLGNPNAWRGQVDDPATCASPGPADDLVDLMQCPPTNGCQLDYKTCAVLPCVIPSFDSNDYLAPDGDGFYALGPSGIFQRKIVITEKGSNPQILEVNAEVSWQGGSVTASTELSNWFLIPVEPGKNCAGGVDCLVGHWTFDEGVGQVANDSSLWGDDDGVLGLDETEESADPTWTTGKFARALDFDGVDDQVNMGTPSPEINFDDDVSISFWIKPNVEINSSSGHLSFVTKRNAWWIEYNGCYTGALDFAIGQVCTGAIRYDINMAAGRWYFIAATFDRSEDTGNLYIDGLRVAVSDALTDAMETIFVPGQHEIEVGSSAGFDRHPNTVIDDVRVYNYELTPGEILYLAQGRP